MPDLSTIRLREDAPDVRWVLFIDGCPYAWTTDLGQGGRGSLRGSGASSWIGLSEDAIGGVETVGARRVLGGLELPPTIRESLDVKAGELEPNPVTVRLHDVDGLLAQLFGREGKESDILRERIGPGTAALPATGLGPGGTVIGLWDRNIGIERIGPAGERRLLERIAAVLTRWGHAGDTAATAFVLLATLEGTVHAHVLGRPVIDDHRLTDALVEAMLRIALPSKETSWPSSS